MKPSIFLALGIFMVQSVVGRAVPEPYSSTGLVSRDEGNQQISTSAEVSLHAPHTAGSELAARGLRERPKKATKHCKKGKGKRAGSSSGSECPALPTKAQILANWRSNPKFDPSKLFFYSSPPGADDADKFMKQNYPGYSTLIPSFHPNGWEDTWAFEDEISSDFWKLASEAFAEAATGTVYAYLPDGDKNAVTWKSTSYWNDELRILQASRAVTKIIRINVKAPHTKSYMKGSA